MKKFYDRKQEMERLKEVQRQAYEDCSRFVVLTGRRRVGKTNLTTHLKTYSHFGQYVGRMLTLF